jgi:hypothetical protein
VIELEPAYIDVIIRRWQEFTGRTAVLEGQGETFAEVADARLRNWREAQKILAQERTRQLLCRGEDARRSPSVIWTQDVLSLDISVPRNQFLPQEGMFAASTTSTLLPLSRATPMIISSKGVLPGFWNECNSLSWIGIVSPVRIGAVSGPAPWLETVTAPSPLMT